MKLKTGKRFRKARQPWRSKREQRFMRRINRDCRDYWAWTTWGHEPVPGRLIPASKHDRGRWRR